MTMDGLKTVGIIVFNVVAWLVIGALLLLEAITSDPVSAAELWGFLSALTGIFVVWHRQRAAKEAAQNNAQIDRLREEAEAHGRLVQQGRDRIAAHEQTERRIRAQKARYDTAKQRVALLEAQLGLPTAQLAGEAKS